VRDGFISGAEYELLGSRRRASTYTVLGCHASAGRLRPRLRGPRAYS
jgi:hypothetical protein